MGAALVVAVSIIDGLVLRVLRRALHHRHFGGLGLRGGLVWFWNRWEAKRQMVEPLA